MSMMVINKNRYFESQQEDEEVIFAKRKHWLVHTTPIISAILIIALASVFYYLMLATSEKVLDLNIKPFISVVYVVAILYTILFSFLAWLIKYLNVVILTNKHLVEIEQVSLFNRKISVLSLDHIEDVTSEQRGVLRTLLDFGSVHIQTAGEMTNFVFQNFEDPESIEKRIMEAKEAHEKQYHPQQPPQAPTQPPMNGGII